MEIVKPSETGTGPRYGVPGADVEYGVALPLRRSAADGLREDAAPRPSNEIMDDVRDGFCGSPRIGADEVIGEPGATATLDRAGGLGAL